MEWILIIVLIIIIVLLVISRKHESYDAFDEYERTHTKKAGGIIKHTSYTTLDDGHLYGHEEIKSDMNQGHFEAMKRQQNMPNTVTMRDEDRSYITNLVQNKKKVQAIKYIVVTYNIGLREAKAMVDAIDHSYN